jgi:hypothetical protein
MDDVLAGIKIKLARAQVHFDAFDEIAVRHVESDLGFVSGKYNEREQSHSLYFREREPMPAELGAIAGDYIHNLRSSLDNLITHLVTRNHKPPKRSNAFPIFTTHEQWLVEVEQRSNKRGSGPLQGISREDFAAIRGLQPYNGRDEPAAAKADLAVLNRMSNADKHTAMHACRTFSASGISPEIFAQPRVVQVEVIRQVAPHVPLVDGTEVAAVRLRVPDGFDGEVNVDPHVPIGVSLVDWRGWVVGLKKFYGLFGTVVEIVALWDESVREIVPPLADRPERLENRLR